jgi:cytochrome d ubiquinol oxidase subunit II
MLETLPLVFVLLGLVFYVVLGGADFGAAAWQATTRDEDLREHAHTAIGPVWEANHVWLIFVLTVLWTAYPEVFGSIASTLSIALFLAGIGIIVRGFAYALRSGADSPRQIAAIDSASAISSVLTPFALGAAAGGIASGPRAGGQRAGRPVVELAEPDLDHDRRCSRSRSPGTSRPVFLAADAVRRDDERLARACRTRALAAGRGWPACWPRSAWVVGAQRRARAVRRPRLRRRTGRAAGLGGGGASRRSRWCSARASSPPATPPRWRSPRRSPAGRSQQEPYMLPGLTISEAGGARRHAGRRDRRRARRRGDPVPRSWLLFRLTLGGRLGYGGEPAAPPARQAAVAFREGLLARVAVACAVAGFGFLTVAETSWTHAIGIVAFFAFIVTGFLAAAPKLAQ